MKRAKSIIASMKCQLSLAAAILGSLGSFSSAPLAAPLTSLDYRITGTSLQVSPPILSVPKGIAGSVLVSVLAEGSTNSAASRQLSSGAYIEAILRGPGFPEPRRMVSAPNGPLLLPPLNLSGDYQIDGVRLVDASSGATRLEGVPSSVPVHVFDEILISTVTSRPLTLEEIQQKGIIIDESNFRAVEFNVSFVLDGKTIPISFPVVSPQFKDSVEIIPEAEVEAKLKEAASINQKIASEIVQLPKDFETAKLNIQLQGINFQPVDPGEGASLALTIPPIPALMVIPGNIGYLHQFFSVKIFTENGAPMGSGLSVDNVQAHLELPPGPDGLPAPAYDQPGDDPLRFARIGPNKIIQPVLPVASPGPDGEPGNSDDVTRLQPHETGQAEFLVEGLQEGLHVMNLDLSADLYGLAAGVVKVKGKAAGSVLVRNPKFSIAFTHPRTVRAGEPYTATVTVLNTGITPANLVQVNLNRNSLSGARLDANQSETVQLNTILPGETAIATYHLVAERTGQITFSDLTTSDDSVVGRFRFKMGVDAEGVPLSPDTIGMPDFVNALPPNLLAAANRVLGQALSIATAAQLPPGISPVGNSIIARRVIDLAEAGQRLRYGDTLQRVLPDLLRDWQGGRQPDDGFDRLLRLSDAGQEWRSVLFSEMEIADGLNGTHRLVDRAPDLAGLGQEFILAGSSSGDLSMEFTGGTNTANILRSWQAYASLYASTNGAWAVSSWETNAVFIWSFTNSPAMADMSVLLVRTNGQAVQLRWTVSNPPVTAIYRFALNDPSQKIRVDLDGDGSSDQELNPTVNSVQELPPGLIAVEQDLTIVAGRPASPCVGPSFGNYGTVLAVVFSKPVTQSSAGSPAAYSVEGDNGANSVQVQPGGRVALLNLRKGVSAIRPRKISFSGVTDVRGNPLTIPPAPIHSVYPDTTALFTGGTSVRGRVLKGDGSPAAGVPVTLTMYDQVHGPYSCEDWIRRVSQVITDSGGNFDLDFVMAGIPYSLSATDTSGLSTDALKLILDSTVADKPDTQVLQQLLGSPGAGDSLLSLLGSTSLPQAVAVVEGLDRALVRDVVPVGSGREGQEVPIALRFRGRATVSGQVVAADGVTPVPNAAVNLYPDSTSRELGRGIFADSSGRFLFAGVPLGVFSVNVATSDKRGATVLGLIDSPGQSTNLTIALPDNPVVYGVLRGQVFDSDNLTPAGNARILLGRYEPGAALARDVVRIVDADADGAWEITNAPVRKLDVIAVTFDGMRKGVRTGITPVANQIEFVNITLQAATTVFGRVQFDDGRPATNALVAGGVALVRTDARGNFQLEGVPVGNAEISAGLERNPSAGIDFPRLGSAQANIIAGAANYVVVKLRPAGRIFGKVFNAQGDLVPNVRVSIPVQGGFYWTDADSNGNYVFENLGLAAYTVSAPANAVAPQINESELTSQIRSGNEDQILAAFKEAISVFVGSNDPLITGEQLNFRPSTWGYTKTVIPFDGANVNADIRYIPQGTVSGTVLNSQGVPIGARVRLTGLGPDATGAPVVTIRGEANSDPATGQFIFSNQLLAGPWGLQTASPFYPTVLTTNGFASELDPDVTNIVLRFPPIQEVNGRIAGHVYNPDGSLAGAGARVHINISSDYEIRTDTNGFFDTQTAFPALGRSYSVEAFDPSSGLKGRASVSMTPGITNIVDVHMLSRNSSIEVVLRRANGLPAAGAQVELDNGSYPGEDPVFAVADTNGVVRFAGLWEGNYAVMAQFTEAATRLATRAGTSVGPNESGSISLVFGATGTIQGTFVMQDFKTPVIGAQVAIGNLGFATTDTNGFFRFEGVPVGTYQIVSSDPVTGGNAVASASLASNGQVQNISLVEISLGTVSGFVLDSYATGFVAGASVQISFSDGLTPPRTVTTGPNGGFAFPGSPPGAFSLSATYKIPGTDSLSVSGRASGLASSLATNTSVLIQLQPLAYLTVRVLRPDGITPAQNVRVRVNGLDQDTGTNGVVQFIHLPVPGSYDVVAISRIGGELHSGASQRVALAGRGTNAIATVVLPGVGAVDGTVVASDGVTPVENAEMTLQLQAPLFSGDLISALTDAQGRFSFKDVSIGSFLVTAAHGSLAASENGILATANETNHVALRLGESGTLLGRVVRANLVTPVEGIDLAIDYTSQSQNAGRAVFRTGPDGFFRFDNIPLGEVHVASAAPQFGGIINFTTTLTNNGQVLDLGDIPFDEDLPRVVQVTPSDTTIEVPITNNVELVFSESLDTNSINSGGIFIRGTNGVIASVLQVLPSGTSPDRIVRIVPLSPLASRQTYEVIVIAGELPGPGGTIIASGPVDLVGRAMPASFLSRFTTADNTPPKLLSIFPANNDLQIDPAAVPRLAFDKSLRATGFVFSVTGPNGLVPGSAAVGINGQVLSFVPTAPLQPNARYSITVSNIFDLAGNRAAGEPFVSSFSTLDTLGPVIEKLEVATNTAPVAGATITVIATLATNEPGASVRFTQDFSPAGSTTNLPFTGRVKMPATGTVTIRAIATDQYGNDGPFAELQIPVQVPRPPAVQFVFGSPTNNFVPSGGAFSLDVVASGDTEITNVTVHLSGALPTLTLSTNTARLRVEGVIPAEALAGQEVQILAQATDSLGLSSGQQLVRFSVLDATPPSLSIVAPENNAHLPPRPSFDVAGIVSDNSSNLVLTVSVSGTIALTQQVAMAVTPNTFGTNLFTIPLTAAPATGGPISLRLGVVDPASNAVSITRSLWLPNTMGPSIATLRIASNLPPTAGFTVPVEALFAEAQTGTVVRFIQDNVQIAAVTNAPWQVFVKLPASGNTVIRAVATDIYGNAGPEAVLSITVEQNTRPTLEFVRVSPASGPVRSGASFSVDVKPSGNSGFYRINATAGGAAVASFASTNGTNLHVVAFIPDTVLAGEQVLLSAEAVDGNGQSTGPQTLSIPVADGSAPAIAILNPPPFAQLERGQPLQLVTLASDNSSSFTLNLDVSGGLAFSRVLPVNVTPNSAVSNLFTIPVPANVDSGSPVSAVLSAADQSGNVRSVIRIFWLPGSRTTVLFNRQALGQSFLCPENGRRYTWPNNNNWSQSAVLEDFCGTGEPVLTAPSNWSSTNYPNDAALDVVVGDGLNPAALNLDVPVTLRSLTLRSNVALNMQGSGGGSSITANSFYFAEDGQMTRNSCCGSTFLVLTNGTMDKTDGSNSFSFESGISLRSYGGTLASESGTLVLPGSDSYYTNGAFYAAAGAKVELVPAGQTANFAGTFTGSGQGAASLSAGTVSAADGGVTFDLPASLFQWTGGTLAGHNPLTNAGNINISGTNGVFLVDTLNNSGQLRHSGAGNLILNAAGSGAKFENLIGGEYLLESDAGISSVSCCGATVFDDYGIFRKNGGSDESIISSTFNVPGGRVDVQTGRLTLANNGSSFDANFTVSAGATLDVTGGRQPTWSGHMSGSGDGRILLGSGRLTASPGAVFDFSNGSFQWAGGTLEGPVTNINTVNVSGADPSYLSSSFFNSGLIRHLGSASLGFLSAGGGASFQNLAGGIYQFENDSGFFSTSCCGPVTFSNFGTVLKNGGTNDSRLDTVLFNNLGGLIQVNSGRLTLANNGVSSNGTMNIAAGAVLDLTGGRSPTWSGQITGTGAGRVELNSGKLNAADLVLDLAPGVFQWTGGTLDGTTVNSNTVSISGAEDVILSGTMMNAKVFHHNGTGNFNLSSGGSGARFINLNSGEYSFESSVAINRISCCGAVNFDNLGIVRKAVGTNQARIAASFNNLGGVVAVDGGSLVLANSGSSTNGTYQVADGAVLDLTGGSEPVWTGVMSGRGSGMALLQSGTLRSGSSLTIDFVDNLFQWTGGALAGLVTNINVWMLSGTDGRTLAGQIYNAALVRHTGTGPLYLSAGGSGTVLRNLPGATYRFEADASVQRSSCCGASTFENGGLVLKSAGSGVAAVSAQFNNPGGTVRVDSGTLVLANSGTSSNGTYLAGAGAVLDITGGADPDWSGQMTGRGDGSVVLASGSLRAGPAFTLNFSGQVFQWSGGSIYGPATNIGVITLSGQGGRSIRNEFFNSGIIRHTGGTLYIEATGAGASFETLPGGVFQFENGGSVERSSCCASTTFENSGTIRKNGTNTASMTVSFSNLNGSFEINQGTLNMGNNPLEQGNGAFTFQLGGTNAGEYGQIAAGNVSLSGPLHVKLAAGFAPPIGTQFQILSSSSLSGTFSSVDLPPGISVSYAANAIVLTVTGQIVAQSLPADLALSVTLSDRADIRLHWKTSGATTLETSLNAGPAPLWMPVTNFPDPASGTEVNFQIPITRGAQFYRIRRNE